MPESQINFGIGAQFDPHTGSVLEQKISERWKHGLFRLIEKTTDWEADGSTKVGGDIVIPFDGTIVDVEGDVDTAGTTGTAIVDINLNGTTIMSTHKLKWDSGEKSTRTYSGTAPTLTTFQVSSGDIITVDIDTNHTTKAKGLTVYIAIQPARLEI